MDYIRDFDVENNKRYPFPKLTPEGKKMALDFQNCIKDTEYLQALVKNDRVF